MRPRTWLAPLVLGSTLAHADPARRVQVLGTPSGCPAPDAVAARLSSILPDTTIVHAPDPSAIVARVDDDGPRYRVEIGGNARTLDDALRRCDDRANAAAVSIALVLTAPREVTAAPRAAPPPTAAPSPASSRTNVDLEAAFAIDGSGASGAALGGGLRLAITRRELGGSLGVAATSPVTIALATGAAAITRVPIDLSFRGGHRWRRFELSGELGFLALVESARGADVARPIRRTDADVGLRLALNGRVWLARRIALTLGVEADALPAPLEIAFHDQGIVGNTPRYWLGGLIGLAFRAR